MLYTACRCLRSRLRQSIQLFLLIGCFLPLGCTDGQERLVSVKFTDVTGRLMVECSSFQRGEIFAAFGAEEAEKAGKDRYEFRAFVGELLLVKLPGKDDDRPIRGSSTKRERLSNKLSGKDNVPIEMTFPYIFRGDEKTPLVFARQSGLAMLNGKVVCVDLTDKAGVQWITQQPDAKLKTIRTLLLSDDAATNTAVLTRMAGSGITIALSDKTYNKSATAPSPAVESEEIRALIAVKPACIFSEKTRIDGNIIAQLPDLTHLVISGEKIPDLTGLKKLRFLGLGDVTNLAPLAKLTQLQGLTVSCGGVTDFTPLRKLTGLQTLGIGVTENLTDLDVLSDMRELRCLVLGLGDKSKIESIEPIGNLTNLTELCITSMPPTVTDLRPLKKLKNLRMLVVDKDGLEKRKDEYDEIRKALPECQVVGFCMGSAWILLVVPAAVGLGLWRRRWSATGKAA